MHFDDYRCEGDEHDGNRVVEFYHPMGETPPSCPTCVGSLSRIFTAPSILGQSIPRKIRDRAHLDWKKNIRDRAIEQTRGIRPSG